MSGRFQKTERLQGIQTDFVNPLGPQQILGIPAGPARRFAVEVAEHKAFADDVPDDPVEVLDHPRPFRRAGRQVQKTEQM